MTLSLLTLWTSHTLRHPSTWVAAAMWSWGGRMGLTLEQATIWGWTAYGYGQLSLHGMVRGLIGVPCMHAVHATGLLTFVLAVSVALALSPFPTFLVTAIHLVALGVALAYTPLPPQSRSFTYLLLALLAPNLSSAVPPLRWFDATPTLPFTHGAWIAALWVVLALAAAKFHEIRHPR